MSQSVGLNELERLVEEQAEMYPLGPCIALAYLSVLKDCEIHCYNEGLEVKRLGGLHVIGTSLHESRRIDNQVGHLDSFRTYDFHSYLYIKKPNIFFPLYKASWQSRKARGSWIHTVHGQVNLVNDSI